MQENGELVIFFLLKFSKFGPTKRYRYFNSVLINLFCLFQLQNTL